MLPRFHFSIERWRKNKEFGVWVSTHGRVRLLNNKKYLEPRINEKGYCFVFTEKGSILIHRLVAYTWLGDKRNEKYTVDHINSNKRDNRVCNLRWVPKNINEAYAKFTQCNVESLQETVPSQTIEQDEDREKYKKLKEYLKYDASKEECTSNFINLLNTDRIRVFYKNNFTNKQLKTYQDVLSIKKNAPELDEFTFISHIVRNVTHANAKKYFSGTWRVEVVDYV